MGWYQYVMAAAYDPFMRRLEKDLKQYRQKLLSQTRGRVLEVGAGTGVNFDFYPKQAHVTAIEPSRAMFRKAKKRLAHPNIRLYNLGIEDDGLEALRPPGGFDFVVSMLVLCSVRDYPAAIERYYKLMSDTGKLLVLEHIHATGTAYGKFQKWINPVWRPLADGCNLTRRQDLDLKKFFRPIEEGYFRLGADWYWAVMKKKPGL